MRACEALVIEPAASWRRLQSSKEFFFEDLDELMKENHRVFLERLMLHERQRFLNADPYERCETRVDHANGFYPRSLLTRMGEMNLQVPRTRWGTFKPRSCVVINGANPRLTKPSKRSFCWASPRGRPARPWEP